MAFTIALEDLGAREFVDDLGRRAGDLSQLMDDIGAKAANAARERIIRTNVGPDGQPWAPSQRARETGGKTLLETGQLVDSITYAASPRSVEIGSNVIYAGIHQKGGEIRPGSANALSFQLPNGEFATVGKVTIPARPYLGLSEDDEGDIIDLTEQYFAGKLR